MIAHQKTGGMGAVAPMASRAPHRHPSTPRVPCSPALVLATRPAKPVFLPAPLRAHGQTVTERSETEWRECLAGSDSRHRKPVSIYQPMKGFQP